MADDPVLLAIESLRDDVRRVGRAVLAARPEPRSDTGGDDDRWALALLPIADSLDRCVRAARPLGEELAAPRRKLWVSLPGDTRVAGLGEGIALALAALEDTLAARGYRLDRPAGAPFDAERHCAVATEPAPEGVAPGHVVRTERAGLWHGARRVREAGVVVAKTQEGGGE